MRQLTDTNRTCQSQRAVSGLPALAVTADCHSGCPATKWKYDPLPGWFPTFCRWPAGHAGKSRKLNHAELS